MVVIMLWKSGDIAIVRRCYRHHHRPSTTITGKIIENKII